MDKYPLPKDNHSGDRNQMPTEGVEKVNDLLSSAEFAKIMKRYEKSRYADFIYRPSSDADILKIETGQTTPLDPGPIKELKLSVEQSTDDETKTHIAGYMLAKSHEFIIGSGDDGLYVAMHQRKDETANYSPDNIKNYKIEPLELIELLRQLNPDLQTDRDKSEYDQLHQAIVDTGKIVGSSEESFFASRINRTGKSVQENIFTSTLTNSYGPGYEETYHQTMLRTTLIGNEGEALEAGYEIFIEKHAISGDYITDVNSSDYLTGTSVVRSRSRKDLSELLHGEVTYVTSKDDNTATSQSDPAQLDRACHEFLYVYQDIFEDQ